jgi:hypothetical protein
MSAQPARHLRVVDTDTGEALDEHPEIEALQVIIKGLERDVRTWIKRYDELKRDKEAEAREDNLWPVAVRIFQAWQKSTAQVRREAGEKRSATMRENSVFDAERFFLVRPYLKNKNHGPEYVLRAVAGIAFDHWAPRRANGSRKRYDEWERVFKNVGEFEERAASAPRDWREREPFAQALDSIKLLTA